MNTYTCLWEFIVEQSHTDEFERHYGPEGSWVQLFRQAPGYIETVLLRDSAVAQRFVTIDRWESAEAYRSFRATFSRQYAELDDRCQRLTNAETAIGSFDELA